MPPQSPQAVQQTWPTMMDKLHNQSRGGRVTNASHPLARRAANRMPSSILPPSALALPGMLLARPSRQRPVPEPLLSSPPPSRRVSSAATNHLAPAASVIKARISSQALPTSPWPIFQEIFPLVIPHSASSISLFTALLPPARGAPERMEIQVSSLSPTYSKRLSKRARRSSTTSTRHPDMWHPKPPPALRNG